MTTKTSKGKSNPFLLSEQVKTILKEKGFTALFNYSDYEFFKRKCKGTFNKAYAIAQLFLADAETEQSDFNNYVF